MLTYGVISDGCQSHAAPARVREQRIEHEAGALGTVGGG